MVLVLGRKGRDSVFLIPQGTRDGLLRRHLVVLLPRDSYPNPRGEIFTGIGRVEGAGTVAECTAAVNRLPLLLPSFPPPSFPPPTILLSSLPCSVYVLQDEAAFDQAFQSAYFKKYIFKVRAKMDTYNVSLINLRSRSWVHLAEDLTICRMKDGSSSTA